MIILNNFLDFGNYMSFPSERSHWTTSSSSELGTLTTSSYDEITDLFSDAKKKPYFIS